MNRRIARKIFHIFHTMTPRHTEQQLARARRRWRRLWHRRLKEGDIRFISIGYEPLTEDL